VVVKVKERQAVNKQRSHRFLMERFSLETLNMIGGKEQFRVEVSNGFVALEIWMQRWKLIVHRK
jgi:hypothetical protein